MYSTLKPSCHQACLYWNNGSKNLTRFARLWTRNYAVQSVTTSLFWSKHSCLSSSISPWLQELISRWHSRSSSLEIRRVLNYVAMIIFSATKKVLFTCKVWLVPFLQWIDYKMSTICFHIINPTTHSYVRYILCTFLSSLCLFIWFSSLDDSLSKKREKLRKCILFHILVL